MHDLDREILTLLSHGTASVEALETATGHPAVEVWRGLTRLFAEGRVTTDGAQWRLAAVAAPA